MEAYVINKHGKNEIYVMIEGMGTTKLEYSKLGEIKVKKGDKFEGYKVPGAFIAEKIVIE